MKNNNFDAIVIGGGLSGLTCAAYLAKAGKKVIVIEQHSRPGGCCVSFNRKGINFNAAVHWVRNAETLNKFLNELGQSEIELHKYKCIFRGIGLRDDIDIPLTKDRAEFENAVTKAFPGIKKESLDKFISLALQIDKEISQIPPFSLELMPFFSRVLRTILAPFKLKTLLKHSRITIDEFLDSLFPEEELKGFKTILHNIAPFYKFPALAILATAAVGFNERASAPVGGAQKISDAFEGAVLNNGGKILYSKKVEKIEIKNGKVTGVKLADGCEYESSCVVTACDAVQTFSKLIDPQFVPNKFMEKLKTPSMDSTFAVSIVTDLDPSKYGFDSSDIFVVNSPDYADLATDDPEKIGFRITFPTLTDPSLRAEGTASNIHAIQIATTGILEYKNYWKAGAELNRGKEYEALKKSYADNLVRHVEKFIPGLSQHILHMDIITPVTYYRYTLNHKASTMGWRRPVPMKQRVPFIKGLYGAGHWFGKGGVTSVVISGRNAASLILKDTTFPL